MYYGARCDKDCPNPKKSFNFDYIAAKVGKLISNLSFTEEELANLDARSNTEIALLETKRLKSVGSGRTQKEDNPRATGLSHTHRLPLLQAGTYTPEGFVAEEARLNGELTDLKKAEKHLTLRCARQ